MPGELILVVEDNDKNRKLVRDVLAHQGYGLLEAEGVARVHGGNLAVMDIFAAEAAFTRPGYINRVDVVVLNRVICCYPDARALLDNTLGAADRIYAVSAPADRGPSGIVNRIFFGISNAWYSLRRAKFRGFRVFVHDLERVDARIRAAGFAPLATERRRFVWRFAVYTRT